MPSIIEEVVLGVFRPGTNNSTFQTLNYTLYALFVSIAFMFWSGTANVHSFVLLFLAIGLFFSVNWFMSELHADASNPTGDADAATEVAEPIEEATVTAAALSSTPTSSSAAVAVATRHSTRKSTAAATTPSSAAAAIADAPKSTERSKRAKVAKAL